MGHRRATGVELALAAAIVAACGGPCVAAEPPGGDQEEERAGPGEASAAGEAAEPALEDAYKRGARWPWRNFNGADLLDPLVPVQAVREGDWGRVVRSTVVPLSLLGTGLALRGSDAKTLDAFRAEWLGLDERQDNYVGLGLSMGLAALSTALPRRDGEVVLSLSSARWGDRATVLGLSLATTAALTEGLKRAIDRRRPSGEDTLSTPSAHSSLAFASAAFTGHMLREWLRPAQQPWGVARIALEAVCLLPHTLALYVALSRVHKEAHFLSDVLVGSALGALVTELFYAWSFRATDGDGRGWWDHVGLTAAALRGGGSALAVVFRF